MANNTKGQQAHSRNEKPNNFLALKGLLNTREMQRRFTEILGQKAPQFMASITNAVAGSTDLSACDPNSVMAAALVAATLDLPIDNNLGFSAIVPYKGKAQFQMMYKGFIQLAIRSGYYERMNYSEVYEDELMAFNPITGEVQFARDFTKCTQRAKGETTKIVGYYAWFRLRTGFSQELFMSRTDVENHARKYSQSYRYDLNYHKKSSRWSIDFDVMAKKTVIKQLLSKWGILSVDMQRAIQDDQKVYEADGTGAYADNTADANAAEAVDAFTLEPDAPQLPEGSDQQAVALPETDQQQAPQPAQTHMLRGEILKERTAK